MGVYSLEIHLKVLICRRLNITASPRAFEIHEIDGLLVLSGLKATRDSAPVVVRENWAEVEYQASSINEFRYLPDNSWNQNDAAVFLQRLRHPPDRVLPWLLAVVQQ